MKEQNKSLAVKESIHARLAKCARENGMNIQGLTERIIQKGLDDLFFVGNVASDNNNIGSCNE